MKHLSRTVLRVVGLLGSGLLASCGGMWTAQPEYGAPVRYKAGKVVSRSTGNSLPGIQVECIESGYATRTAADGSFSYPPDGCGDVRAVDPDGAASGGAFREKTVEAPDSGQLVIELDEE